MNPLVLIILDGFGFREQRDNNAIALAKAPYWNQLLKDYPWTTLDASGEAVGLPAGTMGNSEVGHLTIGSGRIIYQGLSRINHSIEDKSFFQNQVLVDAVEMARNKGKKLHLMGLLSDAGVHSHLNHLLALLQMAKARNIPSVIVHPFLDGRDSPPTSGLKYLQTLLREMKAIGVGEIGTLMGRYYAMDRDKRWERTELAFNALAQGIGIAIDDPLRAIQEAYAEGETDEFVKPRILKKAFIDDGDVVIFFNFRPDRARQITQMLIEKKKLGQFVCMTEYDKNLHLPIAFPPERPKRTLAEILSEQGIKQFHTAETEKYAHVTYFLNGGVESPFPGEERLLVPSPREVPTYDKKPEMSAQPVTETALQKIREGCPVVIMNLANPDMVGHSGVLAATIRAVEIVDECLAKICKEVLARKGTVLITADHGNCEEMIDEHGAPHTAHTTNRVPFVWISERWKKVKLRSQGGLQDVAPTILCILGIPQPSEMTGKPLIIEY